jgi:glycolate oxidase FAD binding subunit
MVARLSPMSEAELAAMVADAAARRLPLAIEGRGSKRHLGRPMNVGAVLDLSGFSGIIDYQPEELIIEVWCATPLADISGLLARHNQHLAFEPPDTARFPGIMTGSSLGGILACHLSGPRRLTAGAARDHVLGITAVSGRGELFKAGAKVVKNVTGYDLPKLMANSWGTLAAMTRITMKVLPRPQSEETITLSGLNPADAVAVMSEALQSAAEVSAAAHDGRDTCLRLEGIPASITYRRDKLVRLLSGRGAVSVLAEEASRKRWADLRDGVAFAGHAGVLWKISVTPSGAPALLAALAPLGGKAVLDWAGGLIWLALPDAPDGHAAAVRGALVSGHATLMLAPEAVRARIAVFQPEPPALAAVTARVKHAFDPLGILNPSRMVDGV